jgi:hypothetical protein
VLTLLSVESIVMKLLALDEEPAFTRSSELMFRCLTSPHGA